MLSADDRERAWKEVAARAVGEPSPCAISAFEPHELELRAGMLRRELLARPDAARAFAQLRSIVRDEVALSRWDLRHLIRAAMADAVEEAQAARTEAAAQTRKQQGDKMRAIVRSMWPTVEADFRGKGVPVSPQRIAGEISDRLKKTGIKLSEPTVYKYRPRR